ncbi:hypothetical protein C8R44DRAFT_988222 [Mycena epipterygia]|nr:hypothetical protein C8R44DRAFT_988222 [Mycena epipterygia]
MQMCFLLQKSWKQHKPLCHYNALQFERGGGEPVLQRNLRHWVTRFDATLLNACVRGLKLKYEWERIDQGGLVIFMEPRPHPNLGSRWRIQNAGMFRNESMINILEKAGMADRWRDDVLPVHNQARERLRKSSGGDADYVTVLMMASNVGPDALQLNGESPFTMRFKPVDVWKSSVAKMPSEKYEGDWCQDLKNQVNNDRPLKYDASKRPS